MVGRKGGSHTTQDTCVPGTHAPGPRPSRCAKINKETSKQLHINPRSLDLLSSVMCRPLPCLLAAAQCRATNVKSTKRHNSFRHQTYPAERLLLAPWFGMWFGGAHAAASQRSIRKDHETPTNTRRCNPLCFSHSLLPITGSGVASPPLRPWRHQLTQAHPRLSAAKAATLHRRAIDGRGDLVHVLEDCPSLASRARSACPSQWPIMSTAMRTQRGR